MKIPLVKINCKIFASVGLSITGSEIEVILVFCESDNVKRTTEISYMRTTI